MDRQEERHRVAIRSLREAMERLEGQEPEGTLYRAGDSWLVWALHGNPYPQALAIFPAADGDGQETDRGISTAVFRKIPLAEITHDARELMPLIEAEEARRALWRLGQAAPSGSRDDLYYALVADAYASVTGLGDKNPVVTLGLVAGVNVDTMRTHIREARGRGLLTGSPGWAGGDLTDKARLLLDPFWKGQHGPEQIRATQRQPIVAAIVTSDRGVLVGKRNDGKPPWTFIAGEVEPGERPDDAAVREVKEETGLLVKAGRTVGERVHPQTGRLMIYLAAKPTHGTEVFVGDEAELSEVRWVGLAEADVLLPGMFEPVHDYLTSELGTGS